MVAIENKPETTSEKSSAPEIDWTWIRSTLREFWELDDSDDLYRDVNDANDEAVIERVLAGDEQGDGMAEAVDAVLKKYCGIDILGESVTEGAEDDDAEPVQLEAADDAEEETGPQQDPADRDHEERIAHLSASVSSTAIEWARLQEATKAVKKEFDTLVEMLRNAVARGPERMPLFDKEKAEPGQDPEADAKDDRDPQQDDTPDTPAAGDAWRDTAIDVLDLPAGIIKSLNEADLTSIGKLADYSSRGGRLIDIAGIGQAKVEKIEEAFERFWSDQAVHQAE